MIPSKLFECIDSGKPFINLCQSANCLTIKYIKNYDMAYTYFINGNNSINDLLSFLKEKRFMKGSRKDILNQFDKCTVKYLINQILDDSINNYER